MKTHVKISAIILCAAVFLCAAPLSGFVGLNLPDFDFSFSASAQVKTGTCGESVTWSLDTDTGVLTISGTGDMNDLTDIPPISPWDNSSYVKSVIIENGVTSIGKYAFISCTQLTSITLSDSVTSINDSAFYDCLKLTSINLPDGLTSIGDNAFHSCIRLISIDLPDSVTNIGYSAFSGCRGLSAINASESNHHFSSANGVLFSEDGKTLVCYPTGKTDTSYSVPDNVTSIGDGAFYGCMGLTSITLPAGVTSIGKYAFYDCIRLTSITLPAGVTSIGESAFRDCTGLTSITIPDSVTSIGEYAFYGCSGLTSITIPDSVTSIGDRAFSYCTELTSISIPDSVTSFGKHAFEGCKGLPSITIPAGLTNLNNFSFNSFNSLTAINVSEGNPDYSSTDGVLFNKDKSIIISYPDEKTDTTYTIPDSVTSIGDSAFEDCTGLTSITIPDSVTSIGDSAFRDCTGLTSVVIPDSVTSIGADAFYGCTGLTSLVIPDSVTSIIDYTFYGCTGLTSITIPDSVTSINRSAFFGCTSLSAIDADEANPVCASTDGILFNKDKSTVFVYPGGKTDTAYTIPDSVTSIGDSAFSNCKGLTSITIPDSVTNIGGGAFSGCTGLTSITLPDTVTSIGYSAFYNCTGLTSITLPDGVTSIGDWAFHNCTGLTSITLPDGVTSIGYFAFEGCTGLTSITLPGTVTSIGYRAFYNCTGVTSITIPAGLTNLNNFSFNSFNSLTAINVSEDNPDYSSTDGVLFNKDKSKIINYPDGKTDTTYTIPDSVTSIGDSAFFGCTGLTSITIPNSVTNIGSYAFYNCTGLTSITIPDSVTSIGDSAFYGCTGLTSITIPDTVTSIGADAFYGCTGLTSITIPDSVTSIGNYAFYNCTGLTSINVPAGLTSLNSYSFNSHNRLTAINVSADNPNYTSTDGILFNKDNTKIFCYPPGKTDTTYTIPDSVTFISEDSFYYCTGLTAINVAEHNPYYSSIDGVLFTKDKTTLIRYPAGKTDTTYTVPDSVKIIDNKAFSGCTGLTSITIPNSVVIIGSSAFSDCTGLTSVTIPNSVTNINKFTFSGCTGLTSITIPNSVLTIGSSAFKDCTGLQTINIPDSVIDLDYYYSPVSSIPTTGEGNKINLFFEGYTALTAINVSEGNCNYSSADGVLFNKEKTNLIIYPPENTTLNYTIPDTVTSLADGAFFSCKKLTSITIPDSVTVIGYGAFIDTISLTDVYIYGKETSLSSSYIGFSTDEATDEYVCNIPTVIHGYPGSTAEDYAKENNLTFIPLDDNCAHANTKLINAKPATCTTEGYTGDTYCNACGKTTATGTTVPLTEHTFTEWTTVKAATVEAEGESERTCTVCNTKETKAIPELIADHKHAYDTAWKSDSTNHWYECSCGEKSNSSAHSFTEWTVVTAATATAEGSEIRVCSVCNYEETKAIPKLTDDHEHAFRKEWKTDSTNHWHECSCGEKSDSSAHSFTEWTVAKAATETAEGSEIRVCSVCNYEETKAIPKLTDDHKHSFGTAWKSDSTNHWHECSCGEKSDSAAHTFSGWKTVNAATVTAKGSETRFCSVCKKTETRSLAKLQPEVKKTLEVKTGTDIKLSADGKTVIVVDGMDVNKLLKSASAGATIITADGKAVEKGKTLASGMMLVLKDGVKILDGKVIVVPGDVDGDATISAADARLALRYSVKLEQLNAWQTAAADTDWDKSGTAADARLILRASVGLEKTADWLAQYK